MYVGALELDVLLGDVHSLKEKRSAVRPVMAELRRRFEVTVAEAGTSTSTAGRSSASPRSRPTPRMCATCWTRVSGWSPGGRSWSCSPPGAGWLALDD